VSFSQGYCVLSLRFACFPLDITFSGMSIMCSYNFFFSYMGTVCPPMDVACFPLGIACSSMAIVCYHAYYMFSHPCLQQFLYPDYGSRLRIVKLLIIVFFPIFLSPCFSDVHSLPSANCSQPYSSVFSTILFCVLNHTVLCSQPYHSVLSTIPFCVLNHIVLCSQPYCSVFSTIPFCVLTLI
jgi:hypothetical protein